MTLYFTTSNAHTEDQGIKMGLYGLAGMGKTMLAATAPRPLVLAVEAGMLSLRTKNIERLFGVGTAGITYDVPAIIIKDFQGLNDAFDFCSQNPAMANIDTIYIDSVTEIAEVVLNTAKRAVKDPRQAYGELAEKMETLIRNFVMLRKHVVMVYKMEPHKDELTGVVRWGPMVPGTKLGPKIPYMYDIMLRMGVNKTPQGQEYRFLQCQPDMQYEAKDRSGALAALEPPHLGHIFNKILGAS